MRHAIAPLLLFSIAFAQTTPVSFENRTASLLIVSAFQDGDTLEVALVNTGKASVTAYSLSRGELSVTREFYPVDEGIAPGKAYTDKLIRFGFAASGPQVASPGTALQLTSAVFADDSAEGDQVAGEDRVDTESQIGSDPARAATPSGAREPAQRSANDRPGRNA